MQPIHRLNDAMIHQSQNIEIKGPMQDFLKKNNFNIKELVERLNKENSIQINQIYNPAPQLKFELPQISDIDYKIIKNDNWGVLTQLKYLMAFESLSSINASHIAHKESTIKNRFLRKLDKSFDWAGSILTSLVHLTTNLFQTVIISPFAIFNLNSRQALKIQGKRLKHDVIACGLGFVGTFSPDSAKKLTTKVGMNHFNDTGYHKSGNIDSKLHHKIERFDTLSNADADYIIRPNVISKINSNSKWSKIDTSFNWAGMVLTSIPRLTSTILKTLIACPIAIFSQDARNAVKIHGTQIGYEGISFVTGLVGTFAHQTARKIYMHFLNKNSESQTTFKTV